MRQQRNMFQTKEQDKTPEEELSEMEISSLPNKKFKGMIIKMLNEFGRRMDVHRASLVAQWLRIRLPMQGTWVWALVQEDATCRRATKPVHHNYWACALEPASHNYWAHVLQLLKPMHLGPVLHNKRSHCNEKPAQHNEE